MQHYPGLYSYTSWAAFPAHLSQLLLRRQQQRRRAYCKRRVLWCRVCVCVPLLSASAASSSQHKQISIKERYTKLCACIYGIHYQRTRIFYGFNIYTQYRCILWHIFGTLRLARFRLQAVTNERWLRGALPYNRFSRAFSLPQYTSLFFPLTPMLRHGLTPTTTMPTQNFVMSRND